MSKKLFVLGLISFSTLASWQASGQETVPPIQSEAPIQLDAPKKKSPDRYGLSFRMGFNITADFKTGFGPTDPIPAPGIHDVNRSYDDGFNKVDVTHNAEGYTAYWGYQNNGQYDAAANTITMHSASGSTDSSDLSGDPQVGFEVTYNRSLGGNSNWRWGFEAAFNFMNLTIRDNQPLIASGTLTSDHYQVPQGYPPPPAPYPGDYFASMGDPLLFDTPASRAADPLSASVTGSRRFDADVFGWRIGPYVEFPLSPKITAMLGAGLSLALVASDFSYDENFTYSVNNSTVTVGSKGSGSHDELMVGGYVSGLFNVAVAKHWGVFAGAQIQDLGHYNQSIGNSQVRLDLRKSVFATFGTSFSF